MQFRWAAVIAGPHEPRERDRAACAVAAPTIAVHHRQSPAKYMDTREATAVFKDGAPALTFEERQSEQHRYQRRQLERMPDELFGVPIWWIGNNRFGACRYLRLCQEVSDEIQIAVIDDVGAANGVAVGAQNVDDGASTSRGFPYAARQALNTQQCFHRGGRRLVTIETPIDEWMPSRFSRGVGRGIFRSDSRCRCFENSV